MDVAAGERWSAFFDTTELAARRIPSARLKATAAKRGAGLYVCQLVVDERAFHLLQDFHVGYEATKATREKFGGYVAIDVGPRKDDQEMLELLKSDLRTRLIEAGFTIVPTLEVTPEDIAAIARLRDPASKGDREPGIPAGLNDVAILLSSMKFARAQGLDRCLFVSKNEGDFTARAIEGLAKTYGGEWKSLRTTDEAIAFLEEPNLAKAATAFIRDRSQTLLSFIDKEKANWADSLLLIGPPILLDLEAFTDERPVDGAEVQLHFRATVRFAQPRAMEPSFRRAAVLYATGFQASVYGELMPLVRAIEGTARARYQKGRFDGELTILEVRPVVQVRGSDVIHLSP